ncbi:hypothetical protein B566_EDAN004535 [Ephemera danica]|nr:hypothetical protein B566_EDAN004535 [Ephemera danica]
MDSLYLTGLPDSLSLQEMLECDIKTEMDVDDCFSLGDLPPLTLDDSLDAKWELIDTQTSNNGLLFPRVTPLHSPGSDMTMWFNASSSGCSGVGSTSLDIDPTSMMVNPSSVMPLTPAPQPPAPPVVSTPPVTVQQPSNPPSIVTTHVAVPTTSLPINARAKIARTNGINIVCNQSTPIAIVRTNGISTATSSTLAHADSNSGNSVRSPATARIKVPLHIQAEMETKAYPKPAYSYSCLIALALKNSANGSLPVSEIYNFMCEHFPYFKTAPNGWKNSVRHNLSLNKCFEKIEKPSGNGSQRKGCLWAMNPTKTSKMDEEVQKWSRKDPQAIRRAMVCPGQLEMLERGEMKRELPSSSTHSGGEDTEESEEEEDEDEDDEDCEDTRVTTPPVSPPCEQPFTPPHMASNLDTDPIGNGHDDEFVDIGVNDGLYDEFGEERLNLGINITPSAKIQGNYICKPSPAKQVSSPSSARTTAAVMQSYICKPSSTSTTVRIRKVQPAILLSASKRQHI